MTNTVKYTPEEIYQFRLSQHVPTFADDDCTDFDDPPCTCADRGCEDIRCKGKCGCVSCRREFQDYGYDD